MNFWIGFAASEALSVYAPDTTAFVFWVKLKSALLPMPTVKNAVPEQQMMAESAGCSVMLAALSI